MKDCTGVYKYKGKYIRFIETYQEWVIEPDSEDHVFVEENTIGGFLTIKDAKNFIDRSTL